MHNALPKQDAKQKAAVTVPYSTSVSEAYRPNHTAFGTNLSLFLAWRLQQVSVLEVAAATHDL